MRSEKEEVRFEVAPRFLVLPYEPMDTLSTATPSVENVRVWKGGGIVVTITNFLKGADNQEIAILGDGTTTISNNANIKTNTGANKLLAANKVYRFTFITGVWYEDA